MGTVLGRALPGPAAVAAASEAMQGPVALEYDLATGSRGERDDHLRSLLCALTGAADATAVNNNAAALLLALNSVALGREVVVSRGELIEIGGSFRLPDIMLRAGVRLIDLSRFGLPGEPTVAEAIYQGADLVTFSGDKLLGGPQAGLIVGRAEMIAEINRNPLKRALRLAKLRIAALVAMLARYRDPDRLHRALPTIRLLGRPESDIRAQAERLRPWLQAALGSGFAVEVVPCRSEIGSGALPVETIPSAALAVTCRQRARAGRALVARAAALRNLPVPVLGRIGGQRLLLNLRCLEDEAAFAANLAGLGGDGGRSR